MRPANSAPRAAAPAWARQLYDIWRITLHATGISTDTSTHAWYDDTRYQVHAVPGRIETFAL